MIDQTTRERQVSASVSTLAIHPEEKSFSSPNVITQANMVYTKSDVSYRYKYVLVVTDVCHAQQSMSVILAVASVAHPEGNSLSSSDVITQANLVYTKSEQNLSVSCRCKYVFGCH